MKNISTYKKWGEGLLLILLLTAMLMPQTVWAETVQIASKADLQAFATRVNAGETKLDAQLTASITEAVDFMIASKENPYAGTFDGNGNSITVSIDAQTENYVGLFRALSGATIQHLTVEGSVKGKSYVGGIVGYSQTPAGKESKMVGCTSKTNVTGTENVGGIVGALTGVLESGISAGGYVTGSVLIDRCTATGQISATRYAGGIVGRILEKNTTAEANVTISNCYFAGSMAGTAKSIGGIVGYMNCSEMGTGETRTLAKVQHCLSTGTCTYAIVGYAGYANVQHCYYTEAEGRQLCGTQAATSTIGEDNGSVTAAQLASGEICSLLNGDVTDGSQAWYQNLSDGSFTFIASDETIVYYDYIDCDATSQSYHNGKGYDTPGHSWTNTAKYLKTEATCTADAVYYQECSRCGIQGTATWTKTGTTHTFAESDSTRSVCKVCNHGFFRYTTNNDNAVSPNKFSDMPFLDADSCSLTILSNGYVEAEGKCVMEFDAPLAAIGEFAFAYISDFTSIIIPNSVTGIGDEAFTFCDGLDSLTIPSSVTSLGEFSFAACCGLSSIRVESGNKVYDSRYTSNAIIETASQTLIQGCKTTVIPRSVKHISDAAFVYCSDLTSITIPDSVSSIGWSAFQNSGLTSVTIPNSVDSIGKWAFCSCINLDSVSFHSIPNVGEYAFADNPLGNCTLALSDASHVASDMGEFPTLTSNPTYTRTGIKNQWGTIVLPFDMAPKSDDYQLYEVENVSDGAIVITPLVNTVEAGTPALIKFAPGVEEITLTALDECVSDTLRSADYNGYTLTGTFAKTNLTDEEGYAIANNAFWNIQDIRGKNEIWSAPFRAYFKAETADAPKLRILLGEETSIDETLGNDTGMNHCFNLQGQRLAAPQKGLNILNGVKVMIK